MNFWTQYIIYFPSPGGAEHKQAAADLGGGGEARPAEPPGDPAQLQPGLPGGGGRLLRQLQPGGGAAGQQGEGGGGQAQTPPAPPAPRRGARQPVSALPRHTQ